MSGVIGHVMYAILGARASRQRNLAISSIIERHFDSYLAGSYLGCDIQTLPEAICIDTGQRVGYGTVPLQKSPLTGGPVRPWSLTHEGRTYRPRDIHRLFYGRAHIVFGWTRADLAHTVPWDHLADYAANVVTDALTYFAPGERQLAYLFGWMAHIVGDSLIKSVHEGIDLFLLDGKYTAKNRPIQDLIAFHEVGKKELGLRWEDLLIDLAETPVEPIQAHYMRVAKPKGRLGKDFPNAWAPELAPLLQMVLQENRTYQKLRTARLLKRYALKKTAAGRQCDTELSRITGGLSYDEMIAAAKQARFRHALWQMGEAVADLFSAVVQREPRLADWPSYDGPTWETLTERWK